MTGMAVATSGRKPEAGKGGGEWLLAVDTKAGRAELVGGWVLSNKDDQMQSK